MAVVWVIGADADGAAALAATLRSAQHEVRVIVADDRRVLPSVVLLGPCARDGERDGIRCVEATEVNVLLVRRPFSPAEVLTAIAEDVVLEPPVVDLVDPDPRGLIDRLDALVAELHLAAEAAHDGCAVHYEAALHQLSRANLSLLEATGG